MDVKPMSTFECRRAVVYYASSAGLCVTEPALFWRAWKQIKINRNQLQKVDVSSFFACLHMGFFISFPAFEPAIWHVAITPPIDVTPTSCLSNKQRRLVRARAVVRVYPVSVSERPTDRKCILPVPVCAVCEECVSPGLRGQHNSHTAGIGNEKK